MRAEYETATRYVHAGVVIVPAEVAAWLLAHGDLNRLRTASRGANPRRDAVLLALTLAAHQHLLAASVPGSTPAPKPEAAADWMNTTTAAGLLGVTDRAVRLACQSHRLSARQVDGRWRITRAALHDYQEGKRA